MEDGPVRATSYIAKGLRDVAGIQTCAAGIQVHDYQRQIF
jgi:hypothetical protein